MNDEDIRRTYLGSHDIAAIAGLNPYLSAMQVYLNKTTETKGQEITEPMRFGTLLQPIILGEFARRMKVELSDEFFYRHLIHEWFGGTPDALIKGRKEGVDAKNIGFKSSEWGEEGTDQVPPYVFFQAHHFLTLFDYKRWYIAVLFGANRYETFVVNRNEEMSSIILELGSVFWNDHVLPKVPPAIDGSKASRKLLTSLFPDDDGKYREAEESEIGLIELYKQAKEKEESAKEELDYLRNRLMESIGDKKGIKYGDGGKAIVINKKGRETIDKKLLSEKYPEVAEECTKLGEPSKEIRVY